MRGAGADVLTSDQIDRYEADGYVVAADVLGRDELAQARQAADEWLDVSRSVTQSDDRFDLDAGHSRDSPRLRRLKEPSNKAVIFSELTKHPKILGMVSQLIGEDIRFEASKLNMKNARHGEAIEWHQDAAFYPHTTSDVCAVGIYLDEATAENGCLEVIPGSHKGPVLSHNSRGYFVGGVDANDRHLVNASTALLPVPAGGITIHHVNLLHRSSENRSDRSRRLLLCEYAAADSYPITLDHGPQSSIVRGKDPRAIRCIDQGSIPARGLMPSPQFLRALRRLSH